MKKWVTTALSLLLACLFCAAPISYAADIYKNISQSVFPIFGFDIASGENIVLGGAVAIEENLLATNCHVARAGSILNVKINNKMILARVVYRDAKRDLCIVNVNDVALTPVKLRETKTTQIGEEVFEIANPGLSDESIAKGVITHKYDVNDLAYLTVSAEGTGGGGLFDVNGNLIGIVNWKDPKSIVNFIIPSDIIIKALADRDADTDTGQSQEEAVKDDIKLIGTFGASKIQLVKRNTRCLVFIPGVRKPNQQASVAVWFPHRPNGIFIFSKEINYMSVIAFLDKLAETNDDEYPPSKSKITLDNKNYTLSVMKIKKVALPTFIFAVNDDLSEVFLDSKFFLGKFYQYDNNEKITTIRFGLEGFKEALDAAKKNCNVVQNDNPGK